MLRSQRLSSHYSRILGVGLGVSVAIHAAVFGFGRLHLNDAPADRTLRTVALEETEPLPDETVRPEQLSQAGLNSLAAAIPAGLLSLTAQAVGTPELAEHENILTMASQTDVAAPIVPQPRLDPETVESGLTPIRVLEPIQLASDEKGSGRRGGRGIKISLGGGGRCPAPHGIPGRLPGIRIGQR